MNGHISSVQGCSYIKSNKFVIDDSFRCISCGQPKFGKDGFYVLLFVIGGVDQWVLQCAECRRESETNAGETCESGSDKTCASAKTQK